MSQSRYSPLRCADPRRRMLLDGYTDDEVDQIEADWDVDEQRDFAEEAYNAELLHEV